MAMVDRVTSERFPGKRDWKIHASRNGILRFENGGAEKAELRIEGQGCFLASLFVAFVPGTFARKN